MVSLISKSTTLPWAQKKIRMLHNSQTIWIVKFARPECGHLICTLSTRFSNYYLTYVIFLKPAWLWTHLLPIMSTRLVQHNPRSIYECSPTLQCQPKLSESTSYPRFNPNRDTTSASSNSSTSGRHARESFATQSSIYMSDVSRTCAYPPYRSIRVEGDYQSNNGCNRGKQS